MSIFIQALHKFAFRKFALRLTMAPKKDVKNLGSVQLAKYEWRAEVTGIGKGPARQTKAEAVADLAAAQAAPSRDAMAAVLRDLRESLLSARAPAVKNERADSGDSHPLEAGASDPPAVAVKREKQNSSITCSENPAACDSLTVALKREREVSGNSHSLTTVAGNPSESSYPANATSINVKIKLQYEQHQQMKSEIHEIKQGATSCSDSLCSGSSNDGELVTAKKRKTPFQQTQ